MPAITAVLDGEVRLGLEDHEHDRILGAARKAAERDVPIAVAQGWEFGATTVSASVAIAAAGGVTVFATGGLGGVHRGADLSGDVSAGLDALARHRIVAVSAGAKVCRARCAVHRADDSDGRWLPALGCPRRIGEKPQ